MFAARRERGFTLIEMMVVVTLIGILAAIGYANFSEARAQARDKVRQAQLEELRLAIELYKAKHGRYPAMGCGSPTGPEFWAGPTEQADVSWNAACDNYITGHQAGANFVPDFIEALPVDPIRDASAVAGIYYRTNAAGTAYKVLSYFTVESAVVGETDTAHPFKRYGSGCAEGVDGTTYAIYSAGAQCW